MHHAHRASFVSQATGAAILASVLGLAATVACAEPIDVRVERVGDLVVVDVKAVVAVRPSIVWGVLTDYDHMVDFVTALRSSHVVSREGNLLEVAQTGDAKVGPFHFSFDSVRSVKLFPQHTIESHLIRGDFRKSDYTTKVAVDGANTVITHHGEYIPDRWVPPGIGPSMIRQQTERQYAELMAEMTRRQAMTGGD